MSITQNKKVSKQSQLLSADNLVVLFQIDLTRYDLGYGYFSNDVGPNNQPIVWGGNTYLNIPIQATGFTKQTEGPPSRPKLTIGNVNSLVSGLLAAGDDLVGCEVKRYRTFRQFLDDGSSPDAGAHFAPDIYRVYRKTEENKQVVEFELSSIFDQEGTKLPKGMVLPNYCSFVYRWWNAKTNSWDIDRHDPCPYAGTKYFDVAGQTCTRDKDACGKSLRDCLLRFGNNSLIPISAFPGVGQVR